MQENDARIKIIVKFSGISPAKHVRFLTVKALLITLTTLIITLITLKTLRITFTTLIHLHFSLKLMAAF
jgi:hypothetical protein